MVEETEVLLQSKVDHLLEGINPEATKQVQSSKSSGGSRNSQNSSPVPEKTKDERELNKVENGDPSLSNSP